MRGVKTLIYSDVDELLFGGKSEWLPIESPFYVISTSKFTERQRKEFDKELRNLYQKYSDLPLNPYKHPQVSNADD